MADELYCPQCGQPADHKRTSYGLRSSCDDCGLWSWDGKPLVSAEIHEARKRCHAAFDPVWQNAEEAYDHPPTDRQGQKRIRRAMRNRAYRMLASLTGMPESECHMSTQTDPAKLDRIESAAKLMSPTSVASGRGDMTMAQRRPQPGDRALILPPLPGGEEYAGTICLVHDECWEPNQHAETIIKLAQAMGRDTSRITPAVDLSKPFWHCTLMDSTEAHVHEDSLEPIDPDHDETEKDNANEREREQA